MNITVQTIKGFKQEFKVDPEDEAVVLKQMIEDEVGIPVENQLLFLAGKMVPNDLPLGALSKNYPLLLVVRK